MNPSSKSLASHGSSPWEVVVIGGGLAGLSAAIYLGRALRRTLVLDAGRSLALWEPDVQNYLGFPAGIAGEELLRRGRLQASQHNVAFLDERIQTVSRAEGLFHLAGEHGEYRARRLLLATGLYHLPPEIPGVNECLGHSLFFCKDCDAYRIQNQTICVIGRNNEAVEYALGMLAYSSRVMIALNGRSVAWDSQHAGWVREYCLPVYPSKIIQVRHHAGKMESLTFADEQRAQVDAAFTTRGDVYHNHLAKSLGALADAEGQIRVDDDCRTDVPGFYAAGCVTQANCQMIVAAGQGAAAAQAINRDLFQEGLLDHSLRRFRNQQLREEQIAPPTEV